MKKGRVLHWSNLPEKLQLSRSSFKSCYGVKDPGEIVVRLVGICSFRSEKRLNEKIESLFPKKKKENKTTEGGIVMNNVALPEMLLTSSSVQQFHLFFLFSFFDLFTHSSHLNSS